MVEKIEEFLFDILGLAVPGATLIVLLCLLPFFFVDPDKAKFSFNLSERTLLALAINNINHGSKMLDFLTLPVGILIFFVSYLIGTIVKVLSIYQYELFSLVFDKFINKIIIFIREQLLSILTKGNQALNNALLKRNNTVLRGFLSKFISYLKSIFLFVSGIIRDFFCFGPPNFTPKNEWLKDKIGEKLQEKIDYKPSEWYSLYKVSNVIFAQEKVPTLSIKYLAKYNFYRSLAFIFLFNIFYIVVFFSSFPSIINSWGSKLCPILIIINLIAWLTFHKKFKRYWTLCGDETIVSAYYHLYKEKNTNA